MDVVSAEARTSTGIAQSRRTPFELPAGNVQVAFSGGRTSAYMLHRLLEENGDLPSRVEVTFQNTGREMPETLDFVQHCAERWSVDVKWLEYDTSAAARFRVVDHATAARDGEPLGDLVEKRQSLPNAVSRFCTTELKVRTAKRYLRSLGWDRWTNCTGIRADEPRRLNKAPPRDRWTVWNPLEDAGITKEDVTAFWKAQPFDLRLSNEGGKTWLGNCDGCFLKSENSLARLASEFPDRAAWWEDMEGLLVGRTRSQPERRFRSG